MDKALIRAVETRKKQLLIEYQQKYNLKREIALKEKFMRAILDGTVPSTRYNIEKIAGMLGIELTSDMRFCLI